MLLIDNNYAEMYYILLSKSLRKKSFRISQSATTTIKNTLNFDNMKFCNFQLDT